MMKNVVARLARSGEHIVIRNGEVEPQIGFLGSLHKSVKNMDEVEMHMSNIVSELRQITNEIGMTAFDNIYDIYEYFDSLYHKTRIDSVKELARSITEFIESVAKVMDIEMFSYEKKVAFISNLSEVVEKLGYELHVLDFDYSLPIVFEVVDKKTGETELFRIDSVNFRHVFEEKLLHDLVHSNSIVKYGSVHMCRQVYYLIQRYFKI